MEKLTRAKDYLGQIRIKSAQIRRKYRKVNELRDKAMHITVNVDVPRVQGGRVHDRVSSAVVNYQAKLEDIACMTDDLIRMKHKAIEEIEQLEDPQYMDVLCYRYIDGCTFEQIAAAMGINIRTVYRIHGEALQAFTDKVINAGVPV